MRSVLLVDDEYYIRTRMRKVIDWSGVGFDQVVDCESGADALKLMERMHFDLLVVDISMPLMDGICLCKTIRESNQELQIIILTGYDKFEYAQSAVDLDVCAYILKPVSEEEMLKAVNKAICRMKQKEQLAAGIQESNRLNAQAAQLSASKVFERLLSDTYLQQEEAERILRQYGIAEEKSFGIFYFTTDDVQRCSPTFPENQIVLKLNLIRGHCWIVEKTSYYDAQNNLLRYNQQNSCKIYCGISSLHPGTRRGIQSAYQEACFIYQQRLLEPSKHVFCVKDYCRHKSVSGVEELKVHKAKLYAALREQQSQKIEAALDDVFSCLLNHKNAIYAVHLLVEEILIQIQKTYSKPDWEWNEALFFPNRSLELILSSNSLNQLKDKVLALILKLLLDKSQRCEKAGDHLVRRVEYVVHHHYSDSNLGLTSIAQAMSLNASYLSDAFKRAKGETLNQYITSVRMEKARELLLSGRVTVLDVAEQVGYTDPYYFSKKYKKYWGITPSESTQ